MAVVLLVALGLMSRAMVAAADGPTGTDAPAWDVTPARVSYISGEAVLWRPGAEGWTPAQVNFPLAPGDALAVGSNGTVEVQVGPRAFLRAAAGTQFGLESQEPDFLRFSVTTGQVALDLRDLPPGHTVTLGTLHATLTVEHPGYYRVSTSPDTTAVAAYRGGRGTVAAAAGNPVTIAAGQQLLLTGVEMPTLSMSTAPELSAWDRWNYQRTDALIASASARYVPPGVYGAEALDQYGMWRVVETYGPVWVPAAVPSGWAPYTTGRWLWDPRYGWTWLDEALWGWAPFHYGRWVFVDGSWAWAPGPIVARPVYAPALVAFLDSPVVVERPVCWVALGWGEPVSPWWGRPGFVGRPWWGGWGGPHVVNNVVINRTTVVNVENITVYRNMGVRNAVVAVPPQRFARDPVAKARITHVEVSGLRPLHGPLPVKPISLAPDDAHAGKPPEAIRKPHGPAPGQQGGLPGNAQVPRPAAPGDRVLTTPPAAIRPGHAGVSPLAAPRLQPTPDQTPGNLGHQPAPVSEAAKVPDPARPLSALPGVVNPGHAGAPPRAFPTPGDPGPPRPQVSKVPAPTQPIPAPGVVNPGRPAETAAPGAPAEHPGRGHAGPPPGVEGPALEKSGRVGGPKPVDGSKASGPPPGTGRPEPGAFGPKPRFVPPSGPPVVPREQVSTPAPGRPPAQNPGRESKVVPPSPSAGHAAHGRPMPPPVARQVDAPGRPAPVGYAPMSANPPTASVNRGGDADHGPRKQPGPKASAPDQVEGRRSKADAPPR